jgi:hypothetical protein
VSAAIARVTVGVRRPGMEGATAGRREGMDQRDQEQGTTRRLHRAVAELERSERRARFSQDALCVRAA